MRRRNQGMKFAGIILCIMCVVGFLFLHMVNKLQMDLYNAHEWISVEAVYKNSSSYIETETISDDEGDSETIEYVRYKWYYDYEVNGKNYSCSESGKTYEEPTESERTRTIMVAEDDNSVYMLYESPQDFENSYQMKRKTWQHIWATVCVITFGFLLLKKMFRRNVNN